MGLPLGTRLLRRNGPAPSGALSLPSSGEARHGLTLPEPRGCLTDVGRGRRAARRSSRSPCLILPRGTRVLGADRRPRGAQSAASVGRSAPP